MANADPAEKTQIMLVEYQKAQDSAEHHDSVKWTVTSIAWAANLILMGIVVDSLEEASDDRLLLALASVVGLSSLVFSAIVWFVLSKVMRDKYKKCAEIEKELGMTQHTNQQSSYSAGIITSLHAAITVVLSGVWVSILYKL